MTKIDSRAKGAGFERKIVQALTTWTGEDYQRSPGSGAYSTITGRKDMAGDIICSNPNFKFGIECKKVETVYLNDLINSKKSLLWKHWKQCVTQCPIEKDPLLIFNKNRSPIYCMTESLPKGIIEHFKYEGVDPSCVSKIIKLYIFKFEDLVKLDPKDFFFNEIK